MGAKKSNNRFEKRLMEHLDRLDPNMLQGHLQGLIQEKGFLEGVFNTIHEAVIVVDESLDIFYFNRASETLLGLNESASGEYIGKYLGKYLKQLNWVELLKGGENGGRWWGVSRREMEVFYPEHRYLDFTIMPVTEGGGAARKGRQPYATLIFNDNTETMQANERQVETQKVKAITQLAAGVAHELGNPLNSLGIHLQLLKRSLRKLPDGELQENALKHIDDPSAAAETLLAETSRRRVAGECVEAYRCGGAGSRTAGLHRQELPGGRPPEAAEDGAS